MAEEAPPPGMEEALLQDPAQPPAVVAAAAPQDDAQPPPGMEESLAGELRAAEHGTPAQAALTFLEQGLSTASFGLSMAVERVLGVDPEDIRAREEENTKAAVAGTIGGIVTNPFGATTVATKAGMGAAKLAGVGVRAGQSLASKASGLAVAGAVENMIFQSGSEVGKMLLSDPNQTVGTAAADIGISGLLGGALNPAAAGVVAGPKALWNAVTGKRVGSSLTSIKHGGEVDGLTALNLENIAPKANVHELLDAHQRLGLKPTPGTLASGRQLQDMEALLAKGGGTITGTGKAKEYDEIFKVLQRQSEETLMDASPKSEHAVGREIKNGIKAKLEAELAPIEKAYSELEPVFKKIEVPVQAKDAAIKAVAAHPLAQFEGDAGARFVEKFQKRLAAIKDVDGLKTYRTKINAELSAAYRNGAEEAGVIQEAKNQLTNLRVTAVDDAAERAALETAGTSSYGHGVIPKLKDADAAYTAYKAKLQKIGIEAGLGNINDARSMLSRFAKMSDESFATRIFDKKDLNQIKFFQENFPEQFSEAVRYKKAEILKASTSNAQGRSGALDVGKFLSQVREIGPEVRDILFGPSFAQRLSDIDLVYKNLPGNPNPSGTGHAIKWSKFLKPEGWLEEASDMGKAALLKKWLYVQNLAEQAGGGEAAELAALKVAASPNAAPNVSAFGEMVKAIKQVMKGEHRINKAVGDVFKAGRIIVPQQFMPSEKDRKKLDEKLKDLQANVSPLFRVGEDLGHYLPETQSALAMTASNAVNFLNGIRPQNVKALPFDAMPEESQVQKAAYNRALDIAEQPLMVLDDVKDGMITAVDVGTLRNLYPGLYDRLSQKLYEGLLGSMHEEEQIPYKTRIGISIFLGQPLDSTMTPQAIMAAQPQPQQAPMAQQKPTMTGMKELKKLPELAMTPSQSSEARRSANA